jgi:hypothetical protein
VSAAEANTDWLQNVLASGSATLVHESHTYRVDHPEVLPIEAAGATDGGDDPARYRVVPARASVSTAALGSAI